jgi:hypothetical protein
LLKGEDDPELPPNGELEDPALKDEPLLPKTDPEEPVGEFDPIGDDDPDDPKEELDPNEEFDPKDEFDAPLVEAPVGVIPPI